MERAWHFLAVGLVAPWWVEEGPQLTWLAWASGLLLALVEAVALKVQVVERMVFSAVGILVPFAAVGAL